MNLFNINLNELAIRLKKSQDIERIEISDSEISSLPEEICLLKNLRILSLKNCSGLKTLPTCLQENKELKTLNIKDSKLSKLPENIEYLSGLTKLSLSKQKFNYRTDWSAIDKLSNLNSLELSYSLKLLKGCPPENISNLKKLQFLYLDNNNLKKLPFSYSDLKELILLDISNNKFIEFPEILLFLPKLDTLIFDAELANALPIEIFEIESLKEIKIKGRNLQKYPLAGMLTHIFKIAKKKKFSHSFISLIIDVLKYPEQLEQLDINECIELLNCEVEELVFHALTRLEKLLYSDFRKADSNSLVFFSGRTFEKKGVLKELLNNQQIPFSSKFSKKVTHILLSPGHNLNIAMLENKVLMTEKMMKDNLSFEDPDLKNIYAENLDNIIGLLLSTQSENNTIALQLLENVGLCSELLTELLFLYKKSSSVRIHQNIISILQKSGYLNLAIQFKRRLPLFKISENTLCNNLQYYSNEPEIDIFKLVNLIFKDCGLGKKYALLYLDSKEKKLFFSKILKAGLLDLSGAGLTALPVDFGIFGNEIYSLDLSNNNFDNFPIDALLGLNSLVELNISDNPGIWHYPESILEIKNLKKLIFSKESLSRSISTLLPKLKKKKIDVDIV